MGGGDLAGPFLVAPPDGYLAWRRTEVGGRPAFYGEGGSDGPTVVFLHGWALGSRAYKRAISRLLSRGCRVFAPALPSFGGTADLPTNKCHFSGYAEWLADFMSAVGIGEPALLLGHSFGGAVAITLAGRYPELVSYLVLLNALGGVSPRPPWAWLGAFAREFWPIPQAFDLATALRADLVPNLARNPLGMIRVAHFAQGTDLRRELVSLRNANVPVLVLTSEHDRIIPHAAFEALCDAIGVNGQVVGGGHSWLLANPDSFDRVLGAFVDLQIAEHRATHAPGRAADVRRLLLETRVPNRTAARMLKQAPPLWLMSDTPHALAGDVALCHPPLADGEVRAVARPIEGTQSMRLSIVATDRRGLLADSAAVLAANRMSISHASAATWHGRRLALHSFVVEHGADRSEQSWKTLGEDLRTMVVARRPPLLEVRPLGSLGVEVHNSGTGRSLIQIKARDQVGLLSTLCRWFTDLEVDIESMHARTAKGIAYDAFLVAGDLDESRMARRVSAQERSASRHHRFFVNRPRSLGGPISTSEPKQLADPVPL